MRLFSFLTFLRQPGIVRTYALRRLIAISFILLALALLLHDVHHPVNQVYVYRNSLEAGARITPADVELKTVPTDMVPDNSIRNSQEITGRIVAVTRHPGVVATESDFINIRLDGHSVAQTIKNSSGEQLNMIPITLADPAVASFIAPGDEVNVVSHDRNSLAPITIATGGKVVFAANSTQDIPDLQPGSVLISLPESAAHAVAAAALHQPLTLVVTGSRAQ